MSQKHNCSKPGCVEKALFRCLCTNVDTYMCNLHKSESDPLFNHINHDLVPLYWKPEYPSRNAIVKFLNSEIARLNNVEEVLSNETQIRINEIQTGLEKILENIKKAKSDLSYLIEQVNSITEIPYNSTHFLHIWLKLPPQEAQARIENLKKKNQLPSCDKLYEDLVSFSINFALQPIISPVKILENLNEGRKKNYPEIYIQQGEFIKALQTNVDAFKLSLKNEVDYSPPSNEVQRRPSNDNKTYKQDFEALARQEMASKMRNNTLNDERVQLITSNYISRTTISESSPETTHSYCSGDTISDYSPYNTLNLY